jgi:hypothetical protein
MQWLKSIFAICCAAIVLGVKPLAAEPARLRIDGKERGALCSTAKLDGRGPNWVKMRIPHFGAYVSSHQLRTCRPKPMCESCKLQASLVALNGTHAFPAAAELFFRMIKRGRVALHPDLDLRINVNRDRPEPAQFPGCLAILVHAPDLTAILNHGLCR